MKRALLIVGVQNDLCRRAHRGCEVAGPLSCLASAVEHAHGNVLVVREWHGDKSPYFVEGGGDLPSFCVAGTEGAAFHPDLHLSRQTRLTFRSRDPRELGPSAFRAIDRRGKPLLELLRELGVEGIFVGGNAAEGEVRATVLDALRQGFDVTVVQDGVGAIDEARGREVLFQLRLAGASVLSSGQAILGLYTSGEARL